MGNQKANFLFGSNDDRLKLMKDNPTTFKDERKQIAQELRASGQLGKDEEIEAITNSSVLNSSTTIQNIDNKKKKQDKDDLENISNYIKATSLRYDADSRVRKGYTEEENETLAAEVNARKQKEGPAGKLKSEAKKAAGDEGQTISDDAVEAISDAATHMLSVTKDMSKAEKIKAIAGRIQEIMKKMGQSGAATDTITSKVADQVVQLEKEFEKRNKDTTDLQTKAWSEINSLLLQQINSLVAGKDVGKVDSGKLKFSMQALMNKLKQTITDSGLSSKDFNIGGLDQKLDQIVSKVTPVINSQNDYDMDIARLDDELKKATNENEKKRIRGDKKDLEDRQKKVMQDWKDLQTDAKKLITTTEKV